MQTLTPPEPITVDIRIEQYGSVWLLFGLTEEGTDWLYHELPHNATIAGGVAVPWGQADKIMGMVDRAGLCTAPEF